MSRFVHLHVHSHYSLLDSIVKLDELVKSVGELGMDAVALTDHARMFGALELQNRCKGTGVKPIHGVAVQVPPRVSISGGKKDHQLVLLAENNVGYRNLLYIVSQSWLDNVGSGRELPITSWELLEAHSEGLIALSGDLGGELATWVLRREPERAIQAAEELRAVFGEKNFYIELQRHHGVPEQDEACEELIKLGRNLKIPLVATNNVHYLNEGDHIAHGIMVCIGLEKRVSPEILDKLPIQDLYLRSPGEMEELFQDVPDAVVNTVAIAERCNVTIPTGTYYLPDFEVPEGFNIDSYMHDRAVDGLHRRFDELRDAKFPFDEAEYRERLEMECDVITRMGFAGYFMIVWDFIRWSKENRIPVGPGRGSGAGSIVAWSLGITDINPLRYGLLFERFLNPERVSMPDFDIDFCQTNRGRVIEYVAEKYGRHQVGMIVTFGQLKAKAVVKDVGRVLNVPIPDVNRLSSLIPADPAAKTKLKTLYDDKENAEFRDLVESDERYKQIYDLSLAIEGNVRNTGMHAAGVVIGQSELWNYVPIVTGAADEIVTQFAKDEVEQAGLVKFDFLGLKNLTVIQDALDIIERSTGKKLDFNTVDLNDPPTYKVIQAGDTAGIFQMESEGFQRLVRRLKPDQFEDLIAVVALYRPGPLGTGMVDTYIECKHGRSEPDYLHPLLEDVLKETFGVMVYQEQVMQAAQRLSGYTLGGADLLRRAMGKKKAEEMAKQRALFVEGAVKNNVDKAKAEEIFDLINHFAGYGFNKSHSAAYAMISFQTAYLKAHYPAAFYAALMTSDAGRADKVSLFILDAKQRNIPVLPPDINESDLGFTVSNGAIRFGLGAIKGLGEGPIEEVERVRKDGPFTSIFDFCERVSLKKVAKRSIEALVRAGAFDSLHLPPDEIGSLVAACKVRARLAASIELAYSTGQQTQDDRESGQGSMFDMFAASAPQVSLADAPAWTDRDLLSGEKELLGVYVSGHPLDRFQRDISLYADTTTAQLGQRESRKPIRLAGMITSFEEKTLRDGQKKMGFLRVEDRYGEVQAMVYSSRFEEIRGDITLDEPVIITGTVRADNFGDEPTLKIAVDAVQPLWMARQDAVRKVKLRLDTHAVDERLLEQVIQKVNEFPGRCALEMELIFDEARMNFELPLGQGVASSDEFIRAMELILGEKSLTLA